MCHVFIAVVIKHVIFCGGYCFLETAKSSMDNISITIFISTQIIIILKKQYFYQSTDSVYSTSEEKEMGNQGKRLQLEATGENIQN